VDLQAQLHEHQTAWSHADGKEHTLSTRTGIQVNKILILKLNIS